MQKAGPVATTTVVVPDHDQIRVGTFQSIIRQPGLGRAAFERE
jgi:hypothetical protein